MTSPKTSQLTNGTRIALTLMRMALALLDREGEPLAAVHLQQAIDTLATR